MPDEQNKLVIHLVETPECCFITDCLKTSGYYYEYHELQIKDLYFDGELPQKTFAKNWLRIKCIPQLVERKVSNEYINERYELKDAELKSEKLPLVIPKEEKDNYDASIIESLYKYANDKLPDRMEPVEVEIQTVLKMKEYTGPSVEYEAIGKWNYSDRVYKITSADLKHPLFDQLVFPEICLANRPCSLSSKQVYDITRQYVLSRIDNSVAKITSNYDFCFDVKKLIPKVEPETVTYQNLFARTKRERSKIRTAVHSYSEYQIFQMTWAPENYRGYTAIPAMYANNEQELKSKMNEWLETLIKIINEPLHECPNCKGTGLCGNVETAKHSIIQEISDRK
jgi:hypothetical protein